MLNDFHKNILKLLSSISLAQFITIIATPILTQYFSPEDFGVYGLYVSMCVIFGSIAGGKYDVAIMLPKYKSDALNILALSILIAFAFSILLYSVMNLFQDVFFRLTNSEILSKHYYIIPISVFLIALNQSILVWLNRQKKYTTIGQQNIIKTTTYTFFSILMGVYKLSFGLILGNIISLFAISFWNIKFLLKDFDIKILNRKKMITNFRRYIDFFKFSTMSNLFNSISNIGMTSIIIIFFGPKIAGLYFLAEKIIAVPISFITSSVSQVYFEKASKLFHSDKIGLVNLTNKIQKNIFFILCPSLIIVSIFGETFFSIFGEQWATAGSILKYFTLYILAKNIYSPISHIGDILNKQKLLLIFNISLFLMQIGSFYFLKSYNNIQIALLTASLLGAMHYLFLNSYIKRLLIRLS